MLGRFWGSSMLSEWKRVSWLINCVLCVFEGCGGDGKWRTLSVSKYFQLRPNMESKLCQQLNVFFLDRSNRVGSPVKILPHIAVIKCEWVRGLPDITGICICQGKTKNSSLTLQMTFTALGHFPGLENLPFGDPVVVSSVVCMPLWMPTGVVSAKSSSVPLVVGKGPSEFPRMAGFAPACPAGRIPFWTAGVAWLVGRMAPGNKGWKINPVKIWGVAGWNERRK